MQNSNKSQISAFRRGLLILKSSWRIFRLERGLLVIELLNGLGNVLLIGGFGLLAWRLHLFQGKFTPYRPAFLGLVFLLYISGTILYSFLMGWFVHMVYERLEGRDPTLASSLAAVRPKLLWLGLYGLMNGVVGFVFQILQDKLPFAGKIVAFLGQLAWAVANIFAIPVIVTSSEPVKPLDAVKQSAGLIKKTWGEGVVSQFSIGSVGALVVTIYTMLAAPLVISGIVSGSPMYKFGSIGLAVAGDLAIIMFLTMIASIAQTVLFYYAKTGKAPEVFDRELLRKAMTPKKARKIFAKL